MRAKRKRSKAKRKPAILKDEPLQRLLILTRAKSGLTQEDMVAKYGCSPTTYKAWEDGQRPRAEWFRAMAKHCDVSLDEIVALATAGNTAGKP